MQASIVLILCVNSLFQVASLKLQHHNLEGQPECDEKWGSFGDGDLVSSVHNYAQTPSVSFADYEDHQHGLQGMFIHPPSQFVFCPIEKNACSVWTRFLNKVFTGNTSAQTDYWISSKSQQKYSSANEKEDVFNNAEATRAVFVRDPLIRFVSAFLDKCTGDEHPQCPAWKGVNTTLRDAVEWALSAKELIDGHWIPQAHHCQLHQRVHNYNFIGLMTRDTLAQDASCLIGKLGLSDYNEFRPTTSHALSEIETLQRFFTPDAARKLIMKYGIDYDTFGFSKEPGWIAGATGEWFEVPAHRVRALKYNGKIDIDDIDDIDDVDDIGLLAQKLGFTA